MLKTERSGNREAVLWDGGGGGYLSAPDRQDMIPPFKEDSYICK